MASEKHRVIHVSKFTYRLTFYSGIWIEFQVPFAICESGGGNDLECVDPRAKLEEINNFNVAYSQLCLEKHREISIGSVYTQEKKWYMDPGLPYSVIDIIYGVLSSRLTISTDSSSELCLRPYVGP
jgi:hypothetical protein